MFWGKSETNRYTLINSLTFNAPGSYSQGFTFLDLRASGLGRKIIIESFVFEASMTLVGDPVGSARSVQARVNLPFSQGSEIPSRFATSFNTLTVGVYPDRVMNFLNINVGYALNCLLSSASMFFYTTELLANISNFSSRMTIVIKC